MYRVLISFIIIVGFFSDVFSKETSLKPTQQASFIFVLDSTASPIQEHEEFDFKKFYGDTLPYRALNAIHEFHKNEARYLEQYIEKNKPSDDYIHKARLNLSYLVAEQFYSYKGGNKFRIRHAYRRNYASWQHVEDSLLSAVKLCNNDASSSSYYKALISSFLIRELERLWDEKQNNAVAFFKDWYGVSPEQGAKLFNADPSNLLQEKIINRYFTGKIAEYLYGLLIQQIITESNPTNSQVIYGRFKEKYPQSKYFESFDAKMDAMAKGQQKVVSSKMLFPAKNGSAINSFKELLSVVKGKTVLLDMWGTWCAPCRDEFTNNGPFIKEHFAGKGLDYLYIANFDLRNEKKWKELITYFNLEGLHILANNVLNKDIMDAVKRNSYPTYIIIKRDGTFQLSKVSYPMNRNVLIKDIEGALAN